VTVNPDGSAVKQMRVSALQGCHKLFCALWSIAGQVDDSIGIKCSDGLPEVSRGLFRAPIERNVANALPGDVRPIRSLQPSTDAQNRMAGGDEPRGQIASNVACSADDRNSHCRLLTVDLIFSLLLSRGSELLEGSP
jgi:hypothetical protein